MRRNVLRVRFIIFNAPVVKILRQRPKERSRIWTHAAVTRSLKLYFMIARHGEDPNSRRSSYPASSILSELGCESRKL
jgi:hypothetical protein